MTSRNIPLWKEKAEIDYIPLFVSLWLALNAWMIDRFPGQNDRAALELLKNDHNPLSDQFASLLESANQDAKGNRFKGNMAELHRALQNAHIPYSAKNPILNGKTISFHSCILDWNRGKVVLDDVMRRRRRKGTIKIDNDLWIDSDSDRVFKAYIEIVYQIRCALFHGRLAPEAPVERVIRQVYLTLSMVMERI